MPSPIPIRPLLAPPDCSVVVPGSKSHTNRALVCAALARGESRLTGALLADDTEAMLSALGALRVPITREGTTLTVSGRGGALDVRGVTVDCRQSGTTSRFLLPALSLAAGPNTLDGHPQLRARPFGPLIDALAQLGVPLQGEGLPLVVPGGGLPGGAARVGGDVSSQLLSGLLLSAPLAAGAVTVAVDGALVSRPYVELTLATMRAFGAEVSSDGATWTVAPTGYRGAALTIEPDASAASYFFAAAAITGGRVRVEGLGASTLQGDLAFVDVLEAMGASVVRGADFTEVTGPARLRGVEVDMGDISDTAQTLAAVAPFADSPTRVTGIGFIRAKETDRVGAVVRELQRLGVDAREEPDGFLIRPGVPSPAVVQTYEDHRMAMSFALIGLRAEGIQVADPGCVAKTFPDYFTALEGLRSSIGQKKA